MGNHSSHARDAAFARYLATHLPARRPRHPHATPAHHGVVAALAFPPAFHQPGSALSQHLAHIRGDGESGRVSSPADQPVPQIGAPHSRLSRYRPHTPATRAVSRLTWSLPEV